MDVQMNKFYNFQIEFSVIQVWESIVYMIWEETKTMQKNFKHFTKDKEQRPERED